MSATATTNEVTLVTTDDPAIQAALAERGITVRKTGAKSLARLPLSEEIGKLHETWVQDDDGNVTKETGNIVEANSVVTANPNPLSNGKLNSWLQDKETFEKNYGTLPTLTTFEEFQKTAQNRAVQIDQALLEVIGNIENGVATLGVSWDPNGMSATVGDYVFDAGYIVNKREYDETYEPVS